MKQRERFNKQTDHCLICHKSRLEDPSFYEVFHDGKICFRCLAKLKPYRGKHSYKIIYSYNEFLRDLLHRVKGLGEQSLAPLFLDEHAAWIASEYKGFTIVPVPSFIKDNERRGFNHVEAIFSVVPLPMQSLFYKKTNHKQATSTDRKEVSNVIDLKPNMKSFPQKVLLVDDVITSGETLKACFILLRDKVNEIEIIVLSRRE